MRVRLRLSTVENVACVLLLTAMSVVVFLQVLFRYVLNSPLVWGEEVSTLLFAWSTFLGSAVAVRQSSHISIDALVTYLPGSVRRSLQSVVDVIVIVLLLIFVKSGIELTLEARTIVTSTLGISQSYVYAAGPVGGVLMLYHYAMKLVGGVRQALPVKGSS
ncbi:MAG: TRAP-type transport system small permease protein [Bacillota bacterium]|nr:TRAP-type transport system small permease protein [Bacillota bacterium]